MQKNNDRNKQQEGSDLADYDCKVEGCEEDMDDVGSIEKDTVTIEGGFKIPAKIFNNNFDNFDYLLNLHMFCRVWV